MKGYEFEKHRHIVLDDADFEAARAETSSVMKVDKFVETASIDPVYYDSSYYMAPDDSGADDVFGVLRQAMLDPRRVALSRVTMARRERAVLITPMEGGLALHTVHEERDLNSASDIFGRALSHVADPEMVALATQLIPRQVGTYDSADVEDRYETRLRAIIDAKLQGGSLSVEQPVAPYSGNVIDLMAALKKSLGGRVVEGSRSGRT